MNNMYHKIFTIKNHEEIKPKIIESIDAFSSKSLINSTDSISRTDWNVPSETPRPYFELLLPFINKEYIEFVKFLGGRGTTIHNLWFQQYYKTDTHTTHCHPGSNFSNIYYVELPHKFQRTEFYDPLKKEFFQFDVKEGDVLTFPAYYAHRSPINKTNDRKTVIVFNNSIEI
jgi:hypothetical protein